MSKVFYIIFHINSTNFISTLFSSSTQEKLKKESLFFTEAKVPVGFSGWRKHRCHSSYLYSPAQVTTII